MKPKMPPALIFALIATTATAATTPNQTTIQTIINTLDLRSFDNSIGPRRSRDKITFKDYGLSKVTEQGDTITLTEADGSWTFVVTLLNQQDGKLGICLVDQATNGGSYHTRNAYLLTPDQAGYLQATAITDSRCPPFENGN